MHRVFNLLWFSDACCYCSILLKSEIIFISVDCVCLSLSLPFFFLGGGSSHILRLSVSLCFFIYFLSQYLVAVSFFLPFYKDGRFVLFLFGSY